VLALWWRVLDWLLHSTAASSSHAGLHMRDLLQVVQAREDCATYLTCLLLSCWLLVWLLLSCWLLVWPLHILLSLAGGRWFCLALLRPWWPVEATLLTRPMRSSQRCTHEYSLLLLMLKASAGLLGRHDGGA
jgi:hypothetical protein